VGVAEVVDADLEGSPAVSSAGLQIPRSLAGDMLGEQVADVGAEADTAGLLSLG
jgi:hypothetical protein